MVVSPRGDEPWSTLQHRRAAERYSSAARHWAHQPAHMVAGFFGRLVWRPHAGKASWHRGMA